MQKLTGKYKIKKETKKTVQKLYDRKKLPFLYYI